MPPTDYFAIALTMVREGGGYCAPLMLLALWWMDRERRRLLDENKAKDVRIVELADRVITVATELRNFLFNERKAG